MLIDYDAANNIGGWQWAASAGTDAALFRILIIISQKFDNDGQFIKNMFQNLSKCHKKYIHQPNLMNEALQTAISCTFRRKLSKTHCRLCIK